MVAAIYLTKKFHVTACKELKGYKLGARDGWIGTPKELILGGRTYS